MFGALAIAGYWFVSRRAMAGPARPRTRNGIVYRPPNVGDQYTGQAQRRYASNDTALWGSIAGILGKVIDRTQTTTNNAPNVYQQENARNSGPAGTYDGSTAGDPYSSGNDGTVANPAPQYGSVYDAATSNEDYGQYY